MSFIEIANEGSVRKAANKLNISASALSRQMRILEEDYGSKLIIRLPRGIEVTESGRELLNKAEFWRKQDKHLRLEMQRINKESLEVLKLGIMECLSQTLPQQIEQGLDHILGQYRLDIKVGNTHSLLAQLESGELDVIIAFNVQDNRQVRLFSHVDCPIGLIYPPSLNLAESKLVSNTPVPLADCLQWPLCLADDELSFQPRIYAEIMRQKKAHTLCATSNSVNVLKQWVIAGRGVTFLTQFDVAKELANNELCFHPLKEKRLSEKLCLCLSTNTPMNQQMRAILVQLDKIIQGD
ncbi:LysR family transcriptional regulator [Marinomonas sp. S3726]|uniref:LysR family transcriptional regulator n=1 Tax=Marinomonas sp. S3726 TaxID=579484 RepID=UPI0031BA0103